jgi:hypothetical protein
LKEIFPKFGESCFGSSLERRRRRRLESFHFLSNSNLGKLLMRNRAEITATSTDQSVFQLREDFGNIEKRVK